jgi:hypothetical protein
MMYYTAVTITTAGFGDIVPRTKQGMTLFIGFWVSCLVVLGPIF